MTLLSFFKRLALAVFRQDEYSQYLVTEKICSFLYPRYKYSEYGRRYLYDERFITKYRTLEEGNYHSLDRKFALSELLKLTSALPGDTAECGAYRGASSYFICEGIAGQDKTHHVFDSFDGLSSPCPKDGEYWRRGDLRTTEETIRSRLSEFRSVVYHKGWIPDGFGDVSNRLFSFVHIDVDLYQPTLDSLCFFYGRLNRGGIIVCDDYGFITCPGTKLAMDEFFADKPENVVSLPTGQAFVIKA